MNSKHGFFEALPVDHREATHEARVWEVEDLLSAVASKVWEKELSSKADEFGRVDCRVAVQELRRGSQYILSNRVNAILTKVSMNLAL